MHYYKSINIDNLISICTKRLDKNPTHKKAIFIRASSLLKKKLYNEAIKDCNNLLSIGSFISNQLDNNNVGALYLRGCCFDKLN